jgi:aspartokinase
LERAFAGELGHGLVEGILVQGGVSIVAVIGASMRGKPGVTGRVFSLMGEQKIDVLAIAQGSSELNLSFVLPTADEVSAVQCIHSAFELGMG